MTSTLAVSDIDHWFDKLGIKSTVRSSAFVIEFVSWLVMCLVPVVSFEMYTCLFVWVCCFLFFSFLLLLLRSTDYGHSSGLCVCMYMFVIVARDVSKSSVPVYT